MLIEQVNLQFIQQAAKTIANIACRTPLRKSIGLSQLCNKNIYLKMETMQHTGAFKLRGAANRMLNLSECQKMAGVITTSSGNHGRAVAYVANVLGIKATIYMSKLVPANKVAGIQQLGAEVVIYGDDQDIATQRAIEIAKQQNMTFISAFDDPYVIAGQGSIALEILEERPEIDTIITQLSGGGLASGIAVAAKALKPEIKIIGVSLVAGAAMYESIKAGKIVEVTELPSVADALPGAIPRDNKYTFDICRRLLDEIVQVSDPQIIAAMQYSFTREKLVLEGGGAATIAAVLQQLAMIESDTDTAPMEFGQNVALICSGDNVDTDQFLGYLQQ